MFKGQEEGWDLPGEDFVLCRPSMFDGQAAHEYFSGQRDNCLLFVFFIQSDL